MLQACSTSSSPGGLPMTRRQKDPLRKLTDQERLWLVRISRSQAEPAAQVARARALLAVAEGLDTAATSALSAATLATPWRVGSQVSTLSDWPQLCRAMAAAIRFRLWRGRATPDPR